MARVLLIAMEPPYLRWYDVNASCNYHYGIKGHSTKNYQALKNQVQALKNAGYVNFGFDKAGGPNVVSNPLPNHSGPKISSILESSTKRRKTCIRDVITHMKVIHEKLVQVKFFWTRRREATKKKD